MLENKLSIVDRAISWIRENTDDSIRRMALISPSSICILDDLNEVNTYFDIRKFKINYPNYWGPDFKDLLPEEISDHGLGVLEGRHNRPVIRNFSTALRYAKEHLSSIDDHSGFYFNPIIYTRMSMHVYEYLRNDFIL
ncbi:hypothetical protein CMI38_05730 [Candidatus Pacearchaeota archaeon]|nr:hypothetical protein [Candidatus Pacearchaeota archaeon]